MQDKEARQTIKGLQSRIDKNKGVLAQEVRRVESKSDKTRLELLERIERLSKEVDDLRDALCRRVANLEDAVYSKFVKREFWEEKQEVDKP